MGRTVKRVSIDFNWPLNKVWGGYLNPYYSQRANCSSCNGSGYSPEAKRFSDEWYGNADFDPVSYGVVPLKPNDPNIIAIAESNVKRSPGYYGYGEIAVKREAQRLFDLFKNQWSHNLSQEDVDALVEANRLMDFTRRSINEEQADELKKSGGYWMKENNGYHPTAQEVNSWSLRGMGHDGVNQFVCIEARCKRAGVPVQCSHCNGTGNIWPSGEIYKQSEDWTPTDPPKGPGYQLWETTSEGSPVSPVFNSLEELCAWAELNATTFGSNKTSKEEWFRMLNDDFVYHQESSNIFT